jgi:hypothetical protein
MFQKILERIVEQTTPARLPKPWDFLPPVPSVRVLESEPSALVTSLRSEFQQEELVNARILLTESDSEHRLTPVFDAKTPFKVLQQQKGGAPCDFEHEHGRLTDGEPAAFRCLDDHLTREQIVRRQLVLATFSNTDLALLTMLGLPATPACGLSSINGEQARRFFIAPKKSTTLPQQNDASAQLPEERPKIILFATELFALKNQLPVGFLHAATQFHRIERAMKLDTAPHIGIWQPSPADFRLIRDGVALADRQLIRNAIKKSVQNAESIQEYFNSTSAPLTDDVPRARKKLLDTLNSLKSSTFGARDLPDRLKDLNQAYEIALLEPAHQQAMAAREPIVASLWIIAAELMEMQFDSSNLAQRTTVAIAKGRAANVDTTVEDRLRLQLRVAEGLIRIKKAIEMHK